MTISRLKSRGWIEGKKLEIPKSPCYTFRYPSGNYIGIFKNKHPNVMEEFKGRIDDYSHRHDSMERN
jgi:hypothetical protein